LTGWERGGVPSRKTFEREAWDPLAPTPRCLRARSSLAQDPWHRHRCSPRSWTPRQRVPVRVYHEVGHVEQAIFYVGSRRGGPPGRACWRSSVPRACPSRARWRARGPNPARAAQRSRFCLRILRRNLVRGPHHQREGTGPVLLRQAMRPLGHISPIAVEPGGIGHEPRQRLRQVASLDLEDAPVSGIAGVAVQQRPYTESVGTTTIPPARSTCAARLTTSPSPRPGSPARCARPPCGALHPSGSASERPPSRTATSTRGRWVGSSRTYGLCQPPLRATEPAEACRVVLESLASRKHSLPLKGVGIVLLQDATEHASSPSAPRESETRLIADDPLGKGRHHGAGDVGNRVGTKHENLPA